MSINSISSKQAWVQFMAGALMGTPPHGPASAVAERAAAVADYALAEYEARLRPDDEIEPAYNPRRVSV